MCGTSFDAVTSTASHDQLYFSGGATAVDEEKASRFSRVLAADASPTVHEATAVTFIGDGRWI
jgi:hypothetical protein